MTKVKGFRGLMGIFALFVLSTLTVFSQSAAPGGNKTRAEPAKQTAGTGHIRTTAAPEIRVTKKVDDSKRTMLFGHVPSVLRVAHDLGRLDPKTPAEHMILVLKSSDAQKHELRRVLDEQQDKNTANYHQWITPEEFGEHFGVHDADIAKVSAWLKSRGFTVEDVAKGKRVLHFSGTTGQLESAFQTQMHIFKVGAETHVSNNSEITVPTALSPVIAGVGMNNFFRKSRMGPTQHLKDLKQNPNFSSSTTTHYVGPWDFAKIYNTQPLLNEGINGTGSSIAVVGRSDIAMSDVQTYRTMFGLPENDPIFIHAGQDNGIQPGDDGESDLDVEISGGIAQNAQVYFVIGTPTFLVDGITNSIEYIVENNTADIMSISYGSCEAVEGVGGNEFNNQAFEQAAAQGISIFVASGDNGPAECDDQGADTYEVLGYATGGESSTPYSVSVGGTSIYEGNTALTEEPYWLATTQQAPFWGESAISYMPEVPWNESRLADVSEDASGSLTDLWSGSGGISSYYLQPSWQRGSGVPTTDPALAQGGNWVTGVTFTNGGGSGYLTAPSVTFSGTGTCLVQPTATTTLSGGSVSGIVFNYGTQGGTLHSGQGFGCTAAPTVTFGAAPNGGTTATGTATIGPMWNTLPLVAGVPHRYTPDLVLNAASGHDATIYCGEGVCEYSISGNTMALADAGLVGGTSVAAPSMAGIQALINQANGGRQGAPNYVYYAISAAQNESACNSSLGASIGSTCAFNDITVGDNLICGESGSACTTGSTASPSPAKMGWQAGVGYDLATGLGSVNAYNLSNAWSSVVFNSSSTTLSLSQTTGITQGTPITISGTVAPGSGNGTPTGDVAFILSSGIFGQTVDVNSGAWSGPSPFATLDGNGNYSATLSNLPGGSYTLTARYAGDQNYASSMSVAVPVSVVSGNATTITITPQNLNDTTTCVLASTTSYAYGQLAWIPVNVAAVSGAGVPTGSVTITVDGNTWGTVPLDPNGNGYLAAGAVYTNSCLYDYIFTQGPFLQGGSHLISASYSGDGTFAAATAAPVSVSVTQLSVTPTLSVGAQNIVSGATVPLVASFASALTTGTSSQASGPTGTVTFTDTTTSTVLGTATVVPNVIYSNLVTSTSAFPSYTYPSGAPGSTTLITTPAGAHTITASYSGDANYAPKTSSTVTVTVDATTPTATTTTVTATTNPTNLGASPALKATIGVASGALPTSGTVTFYDANGATGNVVLGTGTVGSTSTASLTFPTTFPFVGGTHAITAVYGGTSTFASSASAPYTQTVTKSGGTIALAAKLEGSVGKNFTFTAVLTPTLKSKLYAPVRGSVSFYDGATPIGTAPVAGIAESQGGYGLWSAAMSTSALTAGAHTITAQYSDVNFTFTTSPAVTILVGSTPAASWATPAAITYGTKLSATQLNATDSIPGTFVYTPALGTALSAGSHTLSVTFTPAAFYTGAQPVTQTVQIQVNQAPLTIQEASPSSTYGSPLPTLTGNVTGLVNGDTVGTTLAVTYATTASSTSPYSDAGGYPITGSLSGSSAANYSVTDNGGTLTINPANLTITVDSKNIVYGTSLPTFTGTLGGLQNGDTSTDVRGVLHIHHLAGKSGPHSNGGVAGDLTINFSTTASATSPYSNAGNYPITAVLVGVGASNYTVTTNTPGTLAIGKAPLTIQEANALGTYGISLPSFSGNVTGFVNGDVLGGSVIVAYGTTASSTSPYSGAGSYPITATVTGTSAGNYAVTDVGGSLTINPANLTITVDSKNIVYGAPLPTFTGTLGGLQNGDYSTDAKGVIHIHTKARSRSKANNEVAGDLTINFSTTANATSPYSNVGDYPITATLVGAAAGNYTITTNTPGDLNIAKVPLSIQEASPSGIYGSPLPSLTGNVTGNVNGDTVGGSLIVTYSTTASSTSPYSDAGGYPVTATVTGSSAGNYTVTDNGGTLTINPANLTVTVDSKNIVYGAALPTFTGTLGGLQNGDSSTDAKGVIHIHTKARSRSKANIEVAGDLTINFSTTASSTSPYSPVGDYPITATLVGAALGNYTITTNTPGDLNIAKAPLTIQEASPSGTYGSALPTLTGNVTGNVNGDTVGGSLIVAYSTTASSSSPYSDAGGYPVTATVTGSSAGNYTVTDNGGTLTINPANLTISVDNKNIVYGAALPTFTGTLGGLQNGDSSTDAKGVIHIHTKARSRSKANIEVAGDLTINFSTTANSTSPFSPIGDYPITATLSGTASGNYTITTNTPGDLNIAKAPLTIQEASPSGTYGSPLPSLTGNVSGNVNGDTVGGSLIVAYSTTASSTSPYSDAGGYPVTATLTGSSAGNYTVTDNGGTLTINPATLTIAVDSKSGNYGAALPTFTSSLGGLQNGDTSTNVKGVVHIHHLAGAHGPRSNGGAADDLTVNYSTTASSISPFSPVGSYPITATLAGVGAGNYSVTTNTPGTYSINQAPLTLTADNASIVNGTPLPSFSYSVTSGLVNGDSAGAAFSGTPTEGTTATVGEGVGSYPINITTGSLTSANYSFVLVPGTLTMYDLASTISLGSSALNSVVGSPVTFTATVAEATPVSAPHVNCALLAGGKKGGKAHPEGCISPLAPTGTVTFLSGGSPIGTGTISNGVATLITSALGAGSSSITAVYNGDVSFTGSTSSALTEKLAKGTPSITAASSAASVAVGAPLTITATVSDNGPAPTGTVTFYNGNSLIGQGTVSSGQATLIVSNLPGGFDTLSAHYLGDGNYNPVISSPFTQPVTKDATTVSLAPSPASVSIGGALTVTVTVATVGSSPAPTGTVRFFDGTTLVSTGTLAAGVASFQPSTTVAGSHSYTANYSGDGNYSATSGSTSFTIGKATTSVTVTPAANPGTFGTSVLFTANVATTITGTPATGTVNFYAGNSVIGTGTLSGGAATFSTNALPHGVSTISAHYLGDANYLAVNSANLSEVVNKATQSVSVTASPASVNIQSPITLSASVLTVSNGTAATGTVNFYADNVSLGASTITGGVATFKISTLTAGKHSFVAQYNGDTNYTGADSAAASATVVKITPTVTVTSSSPSNTSTLGASVTFTATVTGTLSGTPATGSISFLSGNTVIGQGVLSGNQAILTTTALAHGVDTISVQFVGDANYLPAKSANLSQIVH